MRRKDDALGVYAVGARRAPVHLTPYRTKRPRRPIHPEPDAVARRLAGGPTGERMGGPPLSLRRCRRPIVAPRPMPSRSPPPSGAPP